MCGNGKQVEEELNKLTQCFHVHVILWEGRHLSVKNPDSKVIVSIGRTKKIIYSKRNKNDCLYFNDFCVFPFKLSLNVLLDKILKIKVYQNSPKKHLIGSFNVELATVWSQPNHQFYHKWAVLVDPKSPAGGVKGFIKCDIVILSKGMTVKQGVECDGYLEDNLLVPYGGIKNGLRTRVILSVFRADSFSPNLSGKLKLIHPYIKITYGGKVKKTSIARNRDAPVWNEELIFLDMFPPLMQSLFIEICDIKSNEESLGNTTIDIRSLYEDGSNGFLPTFGPNFLYLYEPMGNFQRHKNTASAENSFTYAARLLLSLRTEVIEKFDKDILRKAKSNIGPEKIPPIIENMYFEYNNFILFAAIFDALLFDAKPKKIKIQLTMGPKKRVEKLKIRGGQNRGKKTSTRLKRKKPQVASKARTEAPLRKKRKRLKETKRKRVPPKKRILTASETESDFENQRNLRKRRKKPLKQRRTPPPRRRIETTSETAPESEPESELLSKKQKELRRRRKERLKKRRTPPPRRRIETGTETEPERPFDKKPRKKEPVKRRKTVPPRRRIETGSETVSEREPERLLHKRQKDLRRRKKKRLKRRKKIPPKKEIETLSEKEPEEPLKKNLVFKDGEKKEPLKETEKVQKEITEGLQTKSEALPDKKLICTNVQNPPEKGIQTLSEIETQTVSEKETQAALGPKPLITFGQKWKKNRFSEKLKNIFSKKLIDKGLETQLGKKLKRLEGKKVRLDVMEKNIQTISEMGIQTISEMETQTAEETKPERPLETKPERPLETKPERPLETKSERPLETKPKRPLKTKPETSSKEKLKNVSKNKHRTPPRRKPHGTPSKNRVVPKKRRRRPPRKKSHETQLVSKKRRKVVPKKKKMPIKPPVKKDDKILVEIREGPSKREGDANLKEKVDAASQTLCKGKLYLTPETQYPLATAKSHDMSLETKHEFEKKGNIKPKRSLGSSGELLRQLNVITNGDTTPSKTCTIKKGYSYIKFSGNFPCINVFGEWPNSLKRMYCCNVIKKAIQNWTDEINKIKDDLQSQPCSKSPQKLNATLANLSESCENILLLTRVIKLDETNLSRERRKYYDKEIADIAEKIKRASTQKPLKAKKELNKIATYLAKLTKYAQDPENSFPNTEIWLLSGNRTLAQHRIKTEDVAYSENFNYRGIMSGKTQTILCRGKKGKIKAKLEILMWFGLAENFEECLKILPSGLNQNNALYSTVSNINIPYELIINEKHDFQCKIHIFQGKIFFGFNNSGLASTFVRVIFRDKHKTTKVCRKTLNPIWDETLLFHVTLYGPVNYIKENPPCVTVEVIDRNKNSNFNLIGRCFIAPLINFNENIPPPKLKWVSVTSEVREVGQILMAAELLEISGDYKVPYVPDSMPVPESIRPHYIKYRLEILFWGIRPLIAARSIKNKVFVVLECGESVIKSPVLSEIHRRLNFPNAIREVELNLPEELAYAPSLNIKLFHIGSISYTPTYVATCLVPSIRFILLPQGPCPCLDKEDEDGRGREEGGGGEEEKITSVLLTDEKKSWLSKFEEKKRLLIKMFEEEKQKKWYKALEEKKNWCSKTYEEKIKNLSKKKIKIFRDGDKKNRFALFGLKFCEYKYVNKFPTGDKLAPSKSKNDNPSDQPNLPNPSNNSYYSNMADTCIPHCDCNESENFELLNPPLRCESYDSFDNSLCLNSRVRTRMSHKPKKFDLLNPPVQFGSCDSFDNSNHLEIDLCDSPLNHKSLNPPVSTKMFKRPSKAKPLNPPVWTECDPPGISESLNPPADFKPSKPPDKAETLNPPVWTELYDPSNISKSLNPPADFKPSKPPDKAETLNPPVWTELCDPSNISKSLNPPADFKPSKPPDKAKPLNPPVWTELCDPSDISKSLNPPAELKTSKPIDKVKPLNPPIETQLSDPSNNPKPLNQSFFTKIFKPVKTKLLNPPVEPELTNLPNNSKSLNPPVESKPFKGKPLNQPVEPEMSDSPDNPKSLNPPDELETCESDSCVESEPCNSPEGADQIKNFNLFYNPNIANIYKKGGKDRKSGKKDEELSWWTRYRVSEECKKEPRKFPRIKIYKEELEAQPEFNGFQDFLQNYLMVTEDVKGIKKDIAVATVKVALKFQKYTENPEEEKGLLLSSFSNHTLKFVVRVYVVCGKNLAPRPRNGKVNPYLFLQLGKNIINDKNHYVSRQLNPTFGKCFEFRGVFPQDYLLQIKVFDRKIKSKDVLIGETTIDLENRFYSKFHATCGLASTYIRSGSSRWRDIYFPSEILRMLCKQLNFDDPVFEEKNVVIEGHTFKTPVPDNEENKIEVQSLMVLKKWHQMPLYGFHLVPEHVEARSLYHSSLKGMEQGKLVLWVDIFPADLANMPPKVDITPQPPVAMELRAIVWNVVDVMLDDKSLQIHDRVSDIYVKGWILFLEEDIQKTDIHYRSLNGEGNFNWRFIFHFNYIPIERRMTIKKKLNVCDLKPEERKVQCKLEIQVWDNDAFGDDFLGTLILELCSMPRGAKLPSRCTLKMLAPNAGTINLFKIKKTRGWWPFRRLKMKETLDNEFELSGKIDLELEILTEEEAKKSPAGPGRNKPNPLPFPNRNFTPDISTNKILTPVKVTPRMTISKAKNYIYAIVAILMIIIFFLTVLYLHQIS